MQLYRKMSQFCHKSGLVDNVFYPDSLYMRCMMIKMRTEAGDIHIGGGNPYIQRDVRKQDNGYR